MSEFGADLSEWLDNGRVRALLELVDQLPRTSRLWSARVNDPEEARIIAAQIEKQGEQKVTPAVSEFDLHADQNAEIIDLLKVLIRNMSGGKGQITPYPRPVTEVHRARKEMERQWADGIIAAMGFK